MSTEIEIKLQIAPRYQQALCQLLDEHRLLQSRSRCLLGNSYFDTPTQQLRQWQIGLRVRSCDGTHEQTIKTAGREVGGLHQRPEYNLPIADPWPQLDAFEGSIWPAGADLAALQAQLAPIFTTHFERQLWQLEFADGSAVEVAFDQGEIAANNHSDPICEVEFELLRGNAEHLFNLAAELARQLPCRIGGQSKAARGYRLAAGKQLSSRALVLLPVDDALTAENRLEQLLAQGLDHLQHHQELLAVSGDLNALFQLREGYQLLQQTLSIYAPLLGAKACERWQQPLAAVLASLARVLDASLIEQLGREQISQEQTVLQLELSHWLFERGWRQEGADCDALAQPLARMAFVASAVTGADRR